MSQQWAADVITKMSKSSFTRVCVLLVTLVAALHVEHGYSQNPQESILELSKKQDFQNLLENQPDVQTKLHSSQELLQNLWREELLQNTSLLTADCTKSIEYIFDDVARLVPLIDATGKPGAGVLGGNTILAAAFDECFNYNYTGYCLANPVFIKNLYTYPWKVGLCVPKYCTNTDLAVLINSTGELWVNESTDTLCGFQVTKLQHGSHSHDSTFIILCGIGSNWIFH